MRGGQLRQSAEALLCGSVIRQVGAISARPGSTGSPAATPAPPQQDAQRFRAVMAPG
jgi:hypothetical protein